MCGYSECSLHNLNSVASEINRLRGCVEVWVVRMKVSVAIKRDLYQMELKVGSA